MDGNGSDSARVRDHSDNSSDDKHDLGDYDIAITHYRNAELEGRPLVEKFFKDIRDHKSLEDPETRSWLGDLPFYMCQDAIPLFVDSDNSGDDSKDYQLHPCYTSLEIDKTTTQPDHELFCLMDDDKMLEDPIPVIGIGRLFINVSNGTAGRTSKWTGYEVFVDRKLALWMVFDTRSLNPRATDWYPVLSGFCPNDEQRIPPFDIACFLPSLRDLADASFEIASKTVQTTRKLGKLKVGLIAQGKVGLLFRTKLDLQKAESSTIRQQPLLPTPSAGDSRDLDTIPNELYTEMLNAVRDGGKDAQKIADLLDKHRDNFSTIRKAITKRIVTDAADNEGCGEQIITILIKQFSDEVRKSISVEVVKAAAGNRPYGAQVIEKLLYLSQDAVCANISIAAICAAAANDKGGARILTMFHEADEEKFKKLILEVFSNANKGMSWPAEVSPRLIEKLKQIQYPLTFSLTSGGLVEQRLPLAKQRSGVEVLQG